METADFDRSFVDAWHIKYTRLTMVACVWICAGACTRVGDACVDRLSVGLAHLDAFFEEKRRAGYRVVGIEQVHPRCPQ